jgi:pyrroline-5-carboxylate reductase
MAEVRRTRVALYGGLKLSQAKRPTKSLLHLFFYTFNAWIRMRNKDITKGAVMFVGGGRITSALIAGLRLKRFRRKIVVYDRNATKLLALKKEFRVEIVHNLANALDPTAMMIVAVRPGSVAGLLNEIAETAVLPKLCISLAAGIPLRVLRGKMNKARWARAMPSPVCRVGRGLTAITFDKTLTEADRKRVANFFRLVGQVVEIPERTFDVFTATYSSSHGYHALANLASAARGMGLDYKTALMAAAHALADGIQYWRESALTLDALLHEAATPGGTAAASVAAMDRAGYGTVVAKGIRAGVDRAKRNARGFIQGKRR